MLHYKSIQCNSVIILQVEELCLSAELQCARSGEPGVAVIGNYLFPKAAAVSGTTNALDIVSQLVREAGGRSQSINVAGAFHSPLMSGASEALRRVLSE